MKRLYSSDEAFTLVELLVSVSLTLVLLATALSNFQRYRRYVRDLTAQSDVRNVSVALQALELDTEESSNFFYSRTGPVSLPGPLGEASLSKGVTMTVGYWSYQSTLLGLSYSYTYRYAYGYHLEGCHTFYKLDYYFSLADSDSEIHYDRRLPRVGRPSDCS